MSAQLKIDQAGLTEGETGRSRTDGKADGALVTLTNTGSGATTIMQLLWAPPGDSTAVASLGASEEDPKVWTFSPTPGQYGTYLIELIQNQGLTSEVRERRVFGVRTPNRGLLIPAFGERADQFASLVNAGDDEREAADNNAIDFLDAALNDVNYAGWWRVMHELALAVDLPLHHDPDEPSLTAVVGSMPPADAYWRHDGASPPVLAFDVGGPTRFDGIHGWISETQIRLFTGGASRLFASFPADNAYWQLSLHEPSASYFVSVGDVGEGPNSYHDQQPGSFLWRLAPMTGEGDPVDVLKFEIVGAEPRAGAFGATPVARPAITGATTQDQVDSLVAALAALGWVTDAR